MKSKWQYSGDVNMLDYGGKNFRHIGNRQWQFIELVNTDDAFGRDNEGHPKYIVELRLVDLDALSKDTIKSAKQSYGQESDEMSDCMLSEFCDAYGAHAPLESFSGNNARKLLRQAHKLANELLDSESLEIRLKRPVNKLGSSALEFMNGDFMSAIQRGCESGNIDARIMAKLHGATDREINDARPADFLPYLMGYICAMNGGTKETDPDTSPEYFRGFERGESVKSGKCQAPGWIQQVKG